MRIAFFLLIGLGVGGWSVSQAEESCLGSSAARVAEYRSASPLLPISPKNTLRVTVLEDGCVRTSLPAYFVDAGLDAERLSAQALADFRSQITDVRLAPIDSSQLKARLQAASKHSKAGRIQHVTTDENIVEFDLFPDPASAKPDAVKRIRWGSLHGDLLNHPDDPDLIQLAALEQLFRAFIERRQAKRETTR